MIYAKFTVTSAEVTTKPVKQWDYGRVLRIQGLKLPTAVRIDFGIVGAQTTISRIGTTKDGAVKGVTSVSPNMTIMTDTEGVIVECEYNKDTNKVVQKLADALGITI